MLKQVCLSVALIVALPAWSQVGTNASGVDTTLTDQAPMLTPAPVGDAAYPTAVGSETRSNYLRAGLTFTAAYSDNVYGGAVAGVPISDIGYSLFPTIGIDQTRPRLHWTLVYGPGFTIYQRTSGYDQSDQNVAVDFQYRLSPHITADLRDSLQKTSDVFSQPDVLSGEGVSGSAQPPPISVIVPVADQLRNVANAELTYQFSRNGMIGVNGVLTNLHYPDATQVSGLYDSSSSGGSAFYSYRLSRIHYMGATYEYSRILTYPPSGQTETETNTALLFYTLYLRPTLSFSVSGGEQHYDVFQFPLPAYGAWSPTFVASMGWQGHHTNFSANYSRVVTGGGGLVGAFHSESAAAFARWRLSRAWSVGSAANYSINKNVTPASLLSNNDEGGHGISGTASAVYQFSQRFAMELGYTHLHQSYNGIPAISNAPNTNREFISFSYQLARPLGG